MSNLSVLKVLAIVAIVFGTSTPTYALDGDFVRGSFTFVQPVPPEEDPPPFSGKADFVFPKKKNIQGVPSVLSIDLDLENGDVFDTIVPIENFSKTVENGEQVIKFTFRDFFDQKDINFEATVGQPTGGVTIPLGGLPAIQVNTGPIRAEHARLHREKRLNKERQESQVFFDHDPFNIQPLDPVPDPIQNAIADLFDGTTGFNIIDNELTSDGKITILSSLLDLPALDESQILQDAGFTEMHLVFEDPQERNSGIDLGILNQQDLTLFEIDPFLFESFGGFNEWFLSYTVVNPDTLQHVLTHEDQKVPEPSLIISLIVLGISGLSSALKHLLLSK